MANDQRKVIYHQRNHILTEADIGEYTREVRADVIGGLVDRYMPADSVEEQWEISTLEAVLAGEFNVHADIQGWLKADNTLENEEIKQRLIRQVEKDYREKVEMVGEENFRQFERRIVLDTIDTQWREHLAAMDYLRQGIHLRSYAQKNPKQEYKREAFAMFQNLWAGIKHSVAMILISLQVRPQEDVEAEVESHTPEHVQAVHAEAPGLQQVFGETRDEYVRDAFSPTQEDGNAFSPEALAHEGVLVHRNDPCPCGSGLKYKQCHGKLA